MRSISGPISRHFLWLSDQDKERMKTILVKALLQESDKSIRDLLAETLQTAAVHEYPDRWPNLLPLLLTTIQSSSSSSLTTHLSVDQQPKNIQILNILWVHNALLAIRKIVKRYEYKLKEQRGPLDVDLAVELVSTYKLFRPHLDFLLYQGFARRFVEDLLVNSLFHFFFGGISFWLLPSLLITLLVITYYWKTHCIGAFLVNFLQGFLLCFWLPYFYI